MSSLHCAVALPFIIAGIAPVTAAQAASLRVGDTVQIVHDVEGLRSNDRAWSTKAEGEDVYENESIRTKDESQARILLVDRTGLSVGPTSTIRIDRMLYNSDQSVKTVVVSTDTGAVRWTSGDSSTYLIRTPTANVTPIGTVFDLLVESERTFVILREGRVRVCTNNQQPTCKTLANPGEMILATVDELQGPGRGSPEPSDFANRCLSATGRNCVINLTYSPPRAPPREPPVTRTRRADVQPRQSRVVEDAYVVPPRRRIGYPTYYPRYSTYYPRYPRYFRDSYARGPYATAGAGNGVPYPRRRVYIPGRSVLYGGRGVFYGGRSVFYGRRGYY
jgi:Tfp pilus assembly protein FimT